MKYLSEVAGIVANGFISVATIAKRMEGKLDSYLISRMMRTITSVYTQKRRLVREHNKALKKSRSKEKVPVSSIRCLIFKGETKNKKLLKELQANKDILNIVNLCICFRKMLKQGQGNLNEWIQKAKESKNNSLVRFAYNIEADKQAVQAAIDTRYSNALLEGSVNRVKSIKRTMYNRAGIELLRVKIIYGL
jgi:transposase